MTTTLEQLTYTLTHTAEGFSGQVYYDTKGIATLGPGIALIVYNSSANDGMKFSLPTSIGKVSFEEFLKLVTGQQNVTQLISILEDDIRSLNQGNGYVSSLSDFGINISLDFFINHIWGGNVGLYETYMDRAKKILDNVNTSIYLSLSDVEKAIVFSLTYAGVMGNNMARALSYYTSSNTEVSFIGKMSVWYEILYKSNNNTLATDRPGQQNRRFMEANTFLTKNLASKPTATTANSTFPISNYNEAKLAIAFMNCKADEMLNFYRSESLRDYSNRNIEIVQTHFNQAIDIFISNNNYTDAYDINTLFIEWNIYTDLQINVNANGRPDGTTSYGNVTGSSLRDIIFITKEENGTIVYANDGDDFVGGGSYNDTIYSGSGNDVIHTYAGNDTVHTTDGTNKDYNEVYLGAGSDNFNGGEGDDFVDGGSGNNNMLRAYSNTENTDNKNNVNTINLGGGKNKYIGTVGTDIVTGTGENTVFLGDGNDIYIGGSGNDTVYGEGGDDTIKAGDGNNTIVGGEGNDRIESGTGNDDIKGGIGSDTIIDRGGNNTIDVGDDNNKDFVSLSGSGTQIILNMTNQDTITCVGGFDPDSVTRQGRDVIIRGNNGAEFIFENVANDEDDEIPEENMPLLYNPDGTVYKWQDGDYVDSGIDYPSYEDYPETIPSISEGETLPSEPNDGDSKTQKDKEPSISEDKKDDVGGLVNGAQNTKSPLVIDLDGDGIETISTDAGVYFDHDNNQKYENTGWIGKDDAFLVRDINGNSEIDNGTEMFGNHTIKSDGTTAYNGFDALKDLDSNKDGKFDVNDEAWDEVKLWKDKNTNGTVEIRELYTLAELGIKHINLNNNYQTKVYENNNIEIQQETYIKTDGTTGKISDVWFDVNGINTKFEETTEIPENIKQLPNIAGFGNVTSLHTAMAMDTTGTLKSLVEQYLATTDEAQKSTLLDNIIYHWTGVQNLPIDGRDPTQVYGKVIDDTRKLEALEEFLGKEYLGIWDWGERDPNPHGHAAPMIIQAYEMLKNDIGTILSANVKNNAYLKAIKLTYNAKTKHWDVDVSQAVALLQADYEKDLQQGRKTIIALSTILEYFDNTQDVYSAFQSYGVIDGTELEQDLLRFGNFSTGSTGSD